MRNPAIILFSLLLLSACSLATFNRYPGTRLPEIPQEYRGYYRQVLVDKSAPDDSSGLRIGNNWWEMLKSDTTQRTYMGDSIVLSSYKGYYFISVKNDTRRYWYVFVVEVDGKGTIATRPVISQGRKFPLRKYMERADSTAGDVVYEMNEERLLKYYTKIIRKHQGIEIKKISE